MFLIIYVELSVSQFWRIWKFTCNKVFTHMHDAIIFTGRATPGIAITPQAILRFSPRRGDMIHGLA